MILKDAVKILVKHLKEDSDYRMTWQANIAMAFQDQYSNINGPMDNSQNDAIHTIANKAADNFLNTLCIDVAETEKCTCQLVHQHEIPNPNCPIHKGCIPTEVQNEDR